MSYFLVIRQEDGSIPNWWANFRRNVVRGMPTGGKLDEALERSVKEFTGGELVLDSRYYRGIKFKTESDATLFVLRWT